MTEADPEITAAEAKILALEAELESAKSHLRSLRLPPSSVSLPKSQVRPRPQLAGSPSDTHFLLLLADSALPLGSFAFSAGLESFLAHTPSSKDPLATFLPESISSLAATTLPFALAAHRDPARIIDLDDALDAATMCTVARRASTAQGRALLTLWERSFVPNMGVAAGTALAPADQRALAEFGQALRKGTGEKNVPPVSAHLAPLFGAVCHALGLSLEQTAYVFVLSHVRAVVSAAVRAGILGPYLAQKVLAATRLQDMIKAAVAREWDRLPEDAGQRIVSMDLWVGRHELLYSRIFNS